MENKNTGNERFDWTLAFILFLFFIVSLIAISSAQTSGQYEANFMIKQLQWYIVGAVIIAVSMLLDPDQYRKLSWIFYGFGILLLALLMVAPGSIAPIRNGAKSWFEIPGIGTYTCRKEFVNIAARLRC